MTGAPSRNAGGAARQARYRERQELLAKTVDRLIDTLSDAVDESGCSWLTDNLPDDRQAKVEAIIDRLSTTRIIAVRNGRSDDLRA